MHCFDIITVYLVEHTCNAFKKNNVQFHVYGNNPFCSIDIQTNHDISCISRQTIVFNIYANNLLYLIYIQTSLDIPCISKQAVLDTTFLNMVISLKTERGQIHLTFMTVS